MWRNIPPARLFGVRILFMTVLSQERVGNCSAPIQSVGALLFHKSAPRSEPAKAAILPRAKPHCPFGGVIRQARRP